LEGERWLEQFADLRVRLRYGRIIPRRRRGSTATYSAVLGTAV
jgi:hypothetical protein